MTHPFPHGRPRPARPPREGDGFVLVGVVMFVLALTILGLSLFGLSSFEAQFLGGSIEEARAFQAAAGGIERAKFALVATDSLQSVQEDLPDGVVYAVAVQDPSGAADSLGAVDWSGEELLIRVLASYREARCMLEARFNPRKPDHYYKRLITARDGVRINLTGSFPTDPGVRWTQTWLLGDAWQQNPDVGWSDIAQPPGGRTVTVKALPVPSVADFIATNGPLASPPPEPVPGYYDLRGGSGDVRYYWSPGDDPDNTAFSVFTQAPSPVIDVTGAGSVVWMAEHGFRFDFNTEVRGTSDDCLILVSPRNDREDFNPQVGPWFFGGIVSPVVPVILVSDDEVRIEHFNDYDESSQVGYLAIFAREAFFMGPIASWTMTLAHTPGATEDVAGGLIDRLCEMGALPNCGATVAASFPTVKGTWRQLNPDNPPDIP